jgi:uncharacterized protein YbjQ (UPF0145 family)
MLVLTIDHAPGHRIVAILGDVIGATVRPDNPYIEGVKSLDGGAPQIDEVIRTRKEAVAAMVDRARLMGANAVVGLRFDHRTIAGTWSEICAYGTAMVLAPRRGLRRPAAPGQGGAPGQTGAARGAPAAQPPA